MQNCFWFHSFCLIQVSGDLVIYLGPEAKFGFVTQKRGAGTLEPGKAGVSSLLEPSPSSELLVPAFQGAWSRSDSTTGVVGEGVSLRLRRGL